MTDFYLITGFLGAGKTTFLKNFLRLFPGQRIRLVINEFGREGVDGRLLAEVGTVLDEICNGSIFCTCRLDRFEQALDDALRDAPDVMVVEASGLADPTNMRAILGSYPALSYRGTVCLVDALQFAKVLATARVCSRQLAAADLALVNKTDLVDEAALGALEQLLNERRPGLPVLRTRYGAIPEGFLDMLRAAPEAPEEAACRQDLTLQKMTVRVDPAMTLDQFQHFIRLFAEESNRLKGIVRLAEGWFLCDCVGAMVRVDPWEGESGGGNRLTALATAGMPLRRALKDAVEWYPGLAAIERE